MLKKKKFLTIFFVIFLAGSILWLYWGNHSIEVTHFFIADKLIPQPFDGFRIVHVSDLHNSEFGENQSILLRKISDAKPDIIAITGDLIDSRHTDIDTAMEFVEAASQIAPIYFVTGNHEAWSGVYPDLKDRLKQAHVTILENEKISISQKGAFISLVGLADPDFTLSNDLFGETDAMVNKMLQDIADNDSNYTIMLSHRPELVNIYANHPINLVLAGHAHGGQFRIPFIGGVIAPDQGLFPKYTAGKYKVSQTQMIVSRGLGNSIVPVRINNRPELVVIELNHQEP